VRSLDSRSSAERSLPVVNASERWTVRALLRHLLQAAVVCVMLFVAPFALAASLPTDTPAPASGAFPARLVVGMLANGWAPFEAVDDGRLTGLSGD
jgi:two-component system, NarL family, sensor histidine kinase EvgS